MIDTDPTEWPVKPRRHQDHVEIYRSERFANSRDGSDDRLPEWRWRLVAGNGRIRAASTQGFNERRKLVDNLETSLHLTMLDQDQQLVGPSWYLYGVQIEFGDKVPQPGEVLYRPVSGIVIEVRTPDRHWTSRRKKP